MGTTPDIRMTAEPALSADLTIGPSALDAYSRLSYTVWYALAEFIDNSTQSRLNYGNVIDEVLRSERKPLQIDIAHHRIAKEMRIEDNSIGMTKERLVEALQIAQPTGDSRGRSRYGMGMKTAACWLGPKWRIETCEWGSGVEWTAEVDVEAIAHRGARVPLTSKAANKDDHYTRLIISDLRRTIQGRTEETTRAYLGSMYMFDLAPGDGSAIPVRITYNAIEIKPPSEAEWDTDPDGRPYRREIPEGTRIGGKAISGWVGILRKGGRRFGGFSLFQNRRQVQGYPAAWKPRSIFGGVDDEGANNLVAQRLTGVLLLDSTFEVSHTKDAILFQGDEEDQLEKLLGELTFDYQKHARDRRGARASTWSTEKIRALVEGMRPEFLSSEMKDAIDTSALPPIEAILQTDKQRVGTVSEAETVASLAVTHDLTVKVSVKNVSECEPYVTISPGAESGVVHVLINGLHPYYSDLDQAAADECITQFMYDAVAEYSADRHNAKVQPATIRRLKDRLMRVRIHQNDHANYTVHREAVDALRRDIEGS